jgi:hypothetical protein
VLYLSAFDFSAMQTWFRSALLTGKHLGIAARPVYGISSQQAYTSLRGEAAYLNPYGIKTDEI